MIWFDRGDRIRVRHLRDAGYTWTAMWGKTGTVVEYCWSSSNVWVSLDGESQSFVFQPYELDKISVLELMVGDGA